MHPITCAIFVLYLFCGVGQAEEAAETSRDASQKGDEAYGNEDWTACADHYARASRLADGGSSPVASYNAACCHALAGNADGAFAELERAIEAGYRDASHLKEDEDLSGLYDDPRWKAAVAKIEAAREAYHASINTELLDLYERDQSDRRVDEIDWEEVSARDAARRERVDEIVAAGGAEVADDYYHAAMVFQHGTEPAHYEKAHAWAMRAVELDPDHGSAKWLAAAAEDRHLMSLGKPQKYGTQFRMVDGRWVLYEVDPAVTDEERARWNVPPIAAARERAKTMNDE